MLATLSMNIFNEIMFFNVRLAHTKNQRQRKTAYDFKQSPRNTCGDDRFQRTLVATDSGFRNLR
jgi:hypothetical protein